jgi:hypothetical protein
MPLPSALVSRWSSAQLPTASPVHPHFCSTKLGAVGRSGRHLKPLDLTTSGWKSSCGVAGRQAGRQQQGQQQQEEHYAVSFTHNTAR